MDRLRALFYGGASGRFGRRIKLLAAGADKFTLSPLTHNIYLCVNSDIDDLSELDHNFQMMNLARAPKQIGGPVRRVRKSRGWSQTQLGEHAGLRQETISLIETGNPAAKLETILAVLAALSLEFYIAPRSKGHASDIEELF